MSVHAARHVREREKDNEVPLPPSVCLFAWVGGWVGGGAGGPTGGRAGG